MFDNARMLDLIERALDADPFCPACGAPTTIEDDAGNLWLVCSASRDTATIARRVSAAILPHRRRRILDLAEHVAA